MAAQNWTFPETIKISALSGGVHPTTIRNYERDPSSVRAASRMRIEEAARQLGLSLPATYPFGDVARGSR